MDSRYPVFNTILMKYIEDNNEISAAADVDIQKIEDALLKFADDVINS